MMLERLYILVTLLTDELIINMFCKSLTRAIKMLSRTLLVLLALFASVTLALFKGETAYYEGESVSLKEKYTMTLTLIDTVPEQIDYNTHCQVPAAQLKQFNNQTGGQFVVLSNKKRDLPSSCENSVGYCDNGGMAGSYDVCPGTRHRLVDASCVADSIGQVFTILQDEVRHTGEITLNAAMNYTDIAVNVLASRVSEQLHTALTLAEQNTIKLVSVATSEMTNQVNQGLNKLSQQTSEAINSVVEQTQSRIADINNALSKVANTTNKLAMLQQQQIVHLTSQLDRLASIMNDNTFTNYDSLLSLSETIQQLITQVYRLGLVSDQGTDISPLLTSWLDIVNDPNTIVFQDNSTADYLYSSKGVIGYYDPELSSDQAYSLEQELVGSYVYKCYEEGEKANVPLDTVDYPDPAVTLSIDTCPFGNDTNTIRQRLNASINVLESILKDCRGELVNAELSVWHSVRYRCCAGTGSCCQNFMGLSVQIYSACQDFPESFQWVYEPFQQRYGLPDRFFQIEQGCYHNGFLVLESTVYNCTLQRNSNGSPVVDIRVSNEFTFSDGITVSSSGECIPRYGSSNSSNITRVYDSSKENYYYFATSSPLGVTPGYSEVLTHVRSGSPDVQYLRNLVNNITQGSTVTVNIPPSKYYSTLLNTAPANNTFTFQHPITKRRIRINKCELYNPSNVNPVSDYGSTEYYTTTDSAGRLVAGGYTGNLPTYYNVLVDNPPGNVKLRLLTKQSKQADSISTPTYYYTPDVWCCSSDLVPQLTVANPEDCSKIGYSSCPSTMFGVCLYQSIPHYRKLSYSSGSYYCPTGYSNPPASMALWYKSPRIYYCSRYQGFTRKHSSLYGVDLASCDENRLPLPGRGVSLITGTVSPAGLYPAACIYYSTVRGSAKLWRISYDQEGVVPLRLLDLRDKLVIYDVTGDRAIDEMDNIYGVGNSGYDCIRYSMDKLLHLPGNCLNSKIPAYSTQAYLSGQVRSSGVSSLLDLFEIRPRIDNSTSNIMYLDFYPKAKIDYESGYIDNSPQCPQIYVSYTSNPKSCLLSGWPITYNPNYLVIVGETQVCNPSGCSYQQSLSDQSETIIKLKLPNKIIECAKFSCSASTNTYVASPLDTFSSKLVRPQLGQFTGQFSNNFTSTINDLLISMNTAVTEFLDQASKNFTFTNGSSTLTLGVQIAAPDLSAVVEEIQYTYQEAHANIDSAMNSISGLLANARENITQAVSNSLTEMFEQDKLKVDQLLDQLRSVAPDQDSQEGFSLGKKFTEIGDRITGSLGLASVALIISCVSLAVNLIMAYVLIRKINTFARLAGKRVIGNKPKTSSNSEELQERSDI